MLFSRFKILAASFFLTNASISFSRSCQFFIMLSVGPVSFNTELLASFCAIRSLSVDLISSFGRVVMGAVIGGFTTGLTVSSGFGSETTGITFDFSSSLNFL